MNNNPFELLNITDEEFIHKIIIPGHYQAATLNSSRFKIFNIKEQIVICANDCANEIGYNNFQEAMFKSPGIDYKHQKGTHEHARIQTNFLNAHKRAYSNIYKNPVTNLLYMTMIEPLLNLQGKVIAKKESELPLKILSHREIIEKHFKRYDVDVICLENITDSITLTEKEELILFMLIGGYSQQEIGEFLAVSRSYISKLISEGLCAKFGLTLVSTKLLIDKAISLGFANFIPNKFIEQSIQLEKIKI